MKVYNEINIINVSTLQARIVKGEIYIFPENT